jgi:hypothetical protein
LRGRFCSNFALSRCPYCASQLALERPSVYEVASRGAPQIVND